MRTLHNYLILYDAECPMCNLYTHAFTKVGMLDPNGRAPYQEVLAPVNASNVSSPSSLTPSCSLIDRQRAVNEIALIDTRTGEVRYGIDSLLKIIGHSIPLLRPLFEWRPFNWTMRKAYAFISYNRKVIIPASLTSTLQPSFSLKYRIAWLLFTIAIAAGILTRYAHLLSGVIPAGIPFREYLICVGQVLCQGMVITLLARDKTWDYLGNMMTISLAGSITLLPAIAVASVTHLSPIIATAWFLLVATLMFLEHIRRTKLLGLGRTLTITWALYRLIVLILILR
jgi:hypothetical protein